MAPPRYAKGILPTIAIICEVELEFPIHKIIKLDTRNPHKAPPVLPIIESIVEPVKRLDWNFDSFSKDNLGQIFTMDNPPPAPTAIKTRNINILNNLELIYQ